MVLNICHDVVLNILVTFSGEHCEAGAELCKALHKGEFLFILSFSEIRYKCDCTTN